jgi:hypothetical protein
VPPPRNRNSGPRKRSPVWELAAGAKAQPGVWVAVDVPQAQTSVIAAVKRVVGKLSGGGYTFTTRRVAPRETTVYCRFNAGGKS